MACFAVRAFRWIRSHSKNTVFVEERIYRPERTGYPAKRAAAENHPDEK